MTSLTPISFQGTEVVDQTVASKQGITPRLSVFNPKWVQRAGAHTE